MTYVNFYTLVLFLYANGTINSGSQILSMRALNLLDVCLQEYQALKAEQTARIGFRDNLLYVTLVLFGGILSFSIGNQNYYSLLVIPWVCLILGWTYLINDEKITSIGNYIQNSLAERISKLASNSDLDSVFEWEIVHQSDSNRRRRKIEQFMIDQITFVVSGMISVAAFLVLVGDKPLTVIALIIAEVACLSLLSFEIASYAELTDRSFKG